MTPSDIAQHARRVATDARSRNPDRVDFYAMGEDEAGSGRVKVRRPHWPDGVFIEVPGDDLGTRAAAGAVIPIRYHQSNPQLPWASRLGAGFGMAAAVAGSGSGLVPTPLGLWQQSNCNVGQNATGGSVASTLYTMDPATVSIWPLPTSDIPEVYRPGLLPFGLVRFQAGEADLYGCAWVQEVSGGSGSAVLVGVWDATRALLWSTGFGITTLGTWTNPDLPYSCRFFHESTNNWMFVLPSLGGSSPEIRSARSAEENARHTIGKPSHNASINSWTDPDVSSIDMTEHPNRIWMCLPFCGAGPVAGEKVDFWFFDEIAKVWGSNGVWMAAEDVPVGGAALVPDLIDSGSAFGGPAAWLGQEALVIVTGGTRDILASGRWLDAHWTCRSIKVDGTPGILAKSKTIVAELPSPLTPSSMESAALAADYTTIYEVVAELGHCALGGSITMAPPPTALNYMHSCPIALPASAPNTARLGGLTSRMVWRDGDRWPVEANMGGGVVVDAAGTAWTCILEPEQVLYGGFYTEEEIGTAQLWQVQIHKFACYDLAVALYYVPSFTSSYTTYNVPGSTWATASYGSPYNWNGYCYPEDAPTRPIWWNMTVMDPVTVPHVGYVWHQYPGTTWRTILRGHKSDGSTIEADITQLLDAVNGASVGGRDRRTTVIVTQNDYPAPDNVWQMLSFPDRGIIAILRDLHADGADNNPTPHIEIWRVNLTTPAKLSTVRLGSYDELLTADDFGNDRRVGDQLWDPYAFGAPRMKGCRDSLTNAPIIVAMVGESKKVDPDTEPQFKRCCYATINCANPSSPEVVRSAQTSPDEGVGHSGDVPGNGPIWANWDTLLLTTGRVAWIRDSEFREASV